MANADDRSWRIEVPADDLFLLRDWLAAEDPLRGGVTPLRSNPNPGEMGGAVEVLTVALGSGGAGAVLARSLCTWLVQRRADVTIIITAPSGGQVWVDVKRARNPESVIREVSTLLGQTIAEAGE